MLFMSLLEMVVNAMEREDLYNTYIKKTIQTFEELGIVRDFDEKWKYNDYINRRNVFMMIYEIYFPESLDVNENQLPVEYSKEIYGERFKDIKTEYDEHLMYELMYFGIVKGRNFSDGEYEAALDDYITYSEALTVICNLLRPIDYINDSPLWYPKTEEEYLKYSTDIGLVNTNFEMDATVLKVDESMLNEYITACDFVGILNRALYIPTLVDGYEAVPGWRYIWNFVDIKTEYTE